MQNARAVPRLAAIAEYIIMSKGVLLFTNPPLLVPLQRSLPVVDIPATDLNPKLIETIPLAVLEITAAGQAPPGTLPNFANPPTRVPVILDIGIGFLLLAFICFLIRIYTKLAIAKTWKWDDCKLYLI